MNEKKSAMRAYFSLEEWLRDKGKDKPIEIKSAMIWGSLWVAEKQGEIDWDTMRLMYGEYMSFAMGLR